MTAIIAKDGEGKIYKSLKDMVQAHGVKYPTFMSRLEKGLPIDKCLEPPKKHVYTYMNIEYSSLKAMAKAHSVEYKTFLSRLKRGVPVNEALMPRTTKVGRPKKVDRKLIES